ncbi:Ribonuclease BN [compost metagenome]
MLPLSVNADVVVHEATFMHDLADTAHEYYHSTSKQAAEAARAANVGQLIMTHFSSRYKDEDQLQPLLEEAQSVFPNTRLANEHQLIPVVHRKQES